MKKSMKSISKILAVFLSLIFIVETLPTQVMAEAYNEYNNEKQYFSDLLDNPAEKAEEEKAEILYEVTEKRDEHTKHFRMSDGTYQAVMYEMPVHIEQNGEWRDYDNTLVEVDSKDSNDKELTNTFGDYSIHLSKKNDNDNLISFSKDGYDVSWNFVDSKKQSAKIVPNEADDDATTLENLVSEVVYEGVFKNTNLQYFVMPEQLKENIILESKSAPKEFTIQYEAKGLTPSLLDAKTVALKDEKGNIQFIIEAPYMTDSGGEASTGIKLNLSNINDNGFVIKISLDEEWLSAKGREFPVIVDPTFHTSQSWTDETISESAYISSDNPSSCYGKGSITHDYEGSIYVGKTNGRGKTRGLIKVPNLPTLSVADKVVNAEMAVFVRANYPEHIIKLYRVTSSWTQSTVCWNSNVQYDSTIVDYQTIPYMEATDQNADRWQRFEITDLVRGWYSGDYSNNGVLLYSDTENNSSQSRVWLFGSGYATYSTPRPVMFISYRNMSGYEDYWSYTNVAAGRNGTASVNNYNGNFVFTQPVTQDAGGNLMPVNISLVYNSNREKSNYAGFGNNMQSNYNIYVKAETNTNINEHYKYFLNDADGTKHWFYFETSSATTAKDEDGLGYTFEIITVGSDANCTNARFRITDKDKNKMYFNSDGYLIQIRSANNVLNTLTYSGNKVSTITDGAGRLYTYSYIGDYCNKITDPSGRETIFIYISGCLTTIKFPDNKSINLVHTYTSVNMLNMIYDIDGLKLNIAYDWTSAFRVSSISCGNASRLLNRYAFEYKQNETKVTEQYRPYEGNIITTGSYTYQFNDFGQTTGIVSRNVSEDMPDNSVTSTEFAQFFDYHNSSSTGSVTSSKNNKVISESKVINSVNNLVINHNFHDGTLNAYQNYSSNGGTAIIDSNAQNFDRYALRLYKPQESAISLVTQEYTGLAAGVYTFSAYVKTADITGTGACIGLKATNSSTGDYTYVYSEPTCSASEWHRISASITLQEGYDLKIICQLKDDSAGKAWLDNLQLEKGIGESNYNMLENSGFNYSDNRWSHDGSVININDLGGFSKALKTTANLSENNTTAQKARESTLNLRQNIFASGTKGDVFCIGAWLKADSAPINELKQGDTYIPRYALALNFYDASDNKLDTKEISVNPDVRTWQFVSGKVIAPQNFAKLSFEVIYYNNVNSVQLTGGFCYREEFGQTYTYDSNGNVISSVDLAKTNSQFNYKSNNLVSMLNPSGSNYLYFYNGSNNVDTAFSTDGLKYYISYDSKGNPTATNTKGVKFATSVDTGKKYAVFNQLTSNALDKNSSSELINYRYANNSNIQQWTFESTGNGVYKMKLGNYYLRVKDTSAGNGAKLELVSSSDNSNRYLFTVTPTTDGAFTISNVYTGATRYLDSTNGETQTAEDGSYVTLRNQPTNNSCQKWYLVEDYTEEVTTGRKIVTSATYTDNQNFLSTQTDQAGNTTAYNYDTTKGTLTSTTNAAGVTTSYQYDQSNNALLSVSSGGMTNSYTYSNDRLTDINVNGATRYSFEYDEFGRTTATKVGNGSSYLTLSSLTYNNRNLLSRQTYGNGDYIEYTYDSLDRIVEQSYNNNIGKKQIAYGSDGNISSTVDFASNTHTRFAYDLAGRVRSIREYEGTTLSGNNLYSSTDYSYADKTNYLTGVNHFSPLGTQKIGYTYGNLSQGTMPDQVYGVSWNSVLKLSNAYDTLARLSKRTINGLDTNYTYVDRENNLTTTLVSSVSTLGITHSYTYDSLGNITSVSNGSNTVTYEYDSLNQLVRVNDPDENQTHIYTYVNGNITEDRVFAYTTAETPANPQRATQYLYQNPVWSDVVTGVKEVYFTEDGEGLQSIRNGNITNNLDSTLATRVLGERYEKVDLSARFKAQREGLVPAEREIAEQNSVIVDNEYSVTSDEIGNITALGDNTYTWLGRQLQSISNDGIATNYSYNADGQRIGKTITLDDSSYNYAYYYNGDILAGYILTLTEGEDSQTYNVVFMYDESGAPFGFTYGGNEYYYVRNAQNDVYMIVDSDNQAVVLYQYDAWGNIYGCYDSSDGSILSFINPYTYRGYYYDLESGYYYLKSRYYNPQLHRFMCADGLTQTGQGMLDKNMFVYCLNNPVNFYDADGHSATVLLGALSSVFPYVVAFVVVAVAAIILSQPKVRQGISTAIGNAIDNIKDKKKDKKKHSNNNNTVYKLVDSDGKTQYIGRTKNVKARKEAHKNNPYRKNLEMVIIKSDLNYYQARGLEQMSMLYYHTKNTKDRMNNQINGISPNNKNLNVYMEAGRGVVGYLDNQISNEILYWSGE